MFLIELSESKLGVGDRLTWSPLLQLLRCDSEHTQYFRHNLNHHTRHLRGRWDSGVDFQASEEAGDFVEEFDKRFTARCRVSRRLREMVLLRPTQREEARKPTTRRILIPEKMIWVGGNNWM
jgi:hypothetical protein